VLVADSDGVLGSVFTLGAATNDRGRVFGVGNLHVLADCLQYVWTQLNAFVWLKIAAPSDLRLDVVRLTNVLTYLLTY